VQNLKNLAICKNELHLPEEAVELYLKALEIDPYEYKCVHGLLKTLQSQGNIAGARKLLSRMKDDPARRPLINQLVEMHLEFALDDDGDDYYTTIFSITQESQDFESVYQTIQSAIDAARHVKNETTQNTNLLGVLLFYQGSALARKYNDKTEAIPIWKECHTLALTTGSVPLMRAGCEAVRQLSSYYFKQAIAAGYGSQEANGYEGDLVKFARIAIENENAWWAYLYVASRTSEMSKLLLGRYHGIHRELPHALLQAQEALRVYMQSGLDLLSDDDPENDWQGYLQLAEVLLHYGDELNALSPWSLIAPHDLKIDPIRKGENIDSEAAAAGKEDNLVGTDSTAARKRVRGPGSDLRW
jgi:tetratricopeptide (TPR) repeat protein